ncbi:MAG: hypothetical protein ACI4U3_09605 [Traorella sp.]
MSKDTICLLRECEIGIQMALHVIEDVACEVHDCVFKELLLDSKDEHEKIYQEIEVYLESMKEEEKELSFVAKEMSWIKTNMKLLVNDHDNRIGEIIFDGCVMGIKKLSQCLNEYFYASEMSKDLTRRLIDLEEKLEHDVLKYL